MVLASVIMFSLALPCVAAGSSDYERKCHAADDAVDYPAAAVFCVDAAEELSVEAESEDNPPDLRAIDYCGKGIALIAAAKANIIMGYRGIGFAQVRSADTAAHAALNLSNDPGISKVALEVLHMAKSMRIHFKIR